MTQAILSLDYLAVLAVTVVGFLFGWLWHSPVMFGKAWMAEMKITDAMMKAAAGRGMAAYFIKGFLYTLISTFGLAVLVEIRGSPNWIRGAVFGAFVGLVVLGARLLNAALWENRSLRLLAINLGHEVVLFTLQGAILGAWR